MADERKFSPEDYNDPHSPAHDALFREYDRLTAAAVAATIPRKLVTITLRLECRADVSATALEWMAGNLAQHAEHEFGEDYDASFMESDSTAPLLSVLDVDVR